MIKKYPKYFFLLFVLIVTIAFFGLIGDFIMAVFWASIFAILFQNKYEQMLSRFPTKPNLSAALTLSLVILVVILPLVLVSITVINEANEAYVALHQADQSLEEVVEDLQEQIPIDRSVLNRIGFKKSAIEENFQKLINEGTQLIAGGAVSFTQNILSFFISFFLMLYVLFFFLRDGKRLVQELMWVVPISDKKEETLLHRFESVARATVKGSLLVALVQGFIGGILFYLLGIPSAFLWGIIMVLASLLPIGSALVWGPWAVFFFFQGDFTRGIILILVGSGFIGLIDNFLRPRLVGRDTKMPDYLILLSTLGGLAWFGISGFVVGPIIAALFTTCWQMLGKEYGKSRDEIVTLPTAEELSQGEGM